MAGLLRILADPLRLRLLTALLVHQELRLVELAIALDSREHAVAYALRLLRTGGLVRRRCEGRIGFYRLSDGVSRELERALAYLQSLAAMPVGNVEEDKV